MQDGKNQKNTGIFLAIGMLVGLLPSLGRPASAAAYEAVAVTGFNQDLIAENTNGLSAGTSTSISFDKTSHVFYTTAFVGPRGTPPSGTGIPANGIISSATYAGVSYQLQSFSSNNVLYLTDSAPNGTLTLNTSGAYNKIVLLASSAEGSSDFDVTVHFSDGTSVTTSFFVYDWFYGSSWSIKGLGRVARDGIYAADGTFEGYPDNPKLFDCFINLSAYNSKLVTSLEISKDPSTSDSRTAIFAVAGERATGTPDTPTATSATGISISSFAANWNSASGATRYRLDVAADMNFSSIVSGYNNRDVGNVTSYTVTGLNPGTTYYYRVRATNASGSSFSSNVVSLQTGTLANASGNSVSANPASQTVGGAITLTAVGDKQSASGTADGETRYIPSTWSSTEGKSGSFTKSGGTYTSTYTPSAYGSHTVTATFQLQTYSSGTETWSDSAGSTDTKTVSVTVYGTPPPAPDADGEGSVISYDYYDEQILFGGVYEVYTATSGGTEVISDATKITPGGTLFIRVKATTYVPAGNWAEITVPQRPATTGLAVSVTDKTDTSITLSEITGGQYSSDGGSTWTDSSGFTGLSQNTDYSMTVRCAATDSAFASAAITSTTVRTKSSPADAPVAPTITEQTDHSVTINTIAGYQYAITAGDAVPVTTWSDAVTSDGAMEFTALTGTATGLSAATMYKIWVRIAETDDAEASNPGSINTYTAQAAPAAGEGYAINYGDETITISAGYEVSGSGDFSTFLTDGASITPGATYYVRLAADTSTSPATPESAGISFTADSRPDAPTTVTSSDETYASKDDGIISNVTTAMEYRSSSAADWTAVSADQASGGITGLSDGVYYVRYKAVTTSGSETFASPAQEVTVAAGKTITVTFDSQGGTDVSEITGKAYGDLLDPPAGDPTKAGYYFAGWYKDGACTEIWSFTLDTVTEDLTLYAGWSQVPMYTITGSAVNDGTPTPDPVSGATVILVQGTVQYGQTAISDIHGDFEIPNVPAGIYNLIVTSGAQKVTTLVEVADADVSVGNVTLPSKIINSTLLILGDAPPDVVVGGLDAEAQAQLGTGTSVEINLTIEEKSSETAENGSAVRDVARAVHRIVGMYLDIDVSKTWNGTVDNGYNETDGLIEIIIPLPEELQGKQSYAIYRYHAGSVDVITNTPNGDGEYIAVNPGKTQLTICVKKFSTYVVTYINPVTTSYNTIRSASDEGGTISPFITEVASGKSKTFFITADDGYEISDVLVDGVSVGTVSSYTFTDVNEDHIIEAVFAEGGTSWANPYGDVTDEDWYFGAVRFVTEYGLMNGTGDTFDPELATTRGMIITILYRMEGQPDTDAAYTFQDVNAGEYYAKAVAWGSENEIIDGYDADRYGPEDDITREQLAAILYRYARYKGYDVSASDDLAGFDDAADISNWALENVQWAVAEEILTGTDTGDLAARDACCRAQAATMLMRFMQKFV